MPSHRTETIWVCIVILSGSEQNKKSCFLPLNLPPLQTCSQQKNRNTMHAEVAKLVSSFLGYTATFAFFVQYLPQMHQNYVRKSTEGFSLACVIVKLVGASFMFANFLIDVELGFVQLYAFVNMFQYFVLVTQAALYTTDSRHIALVLFMPLPIFVASSFLPATRPFTTGLKPVTQVVSHTLLLLECVRIRSVRGVSMSSQFLNLFGGVCGMVACSLTQPLSSWTVWLYINSVGQALTVFALREYFTLPQTPQCCEIESLRIADDCALDLGRRSPKFENSRVPKL